MKIVERSDRRLILRDIPYLQVVMGVFFALIGFLLTYFLGRSIDIHCQRAASQPISCDVVESLLGIGVVRQYTIADVDGADVEEYRDSDGDTYKIIFLTSRGPVPLTGYSSSGYEDKAEVVEQINTFVSSIQQDACDVHIPWEWWILIFLATFGGIGLSIIVLAKVKRVEMARFEGALRITKKGLFHQEEQTFLLHEIERIDLEYSDDASRIVFHTTRGEAVPLSSVYTAGIGDNKKRVIEMMNEFLPPYR